jgi:hypothetical protein
MSQHLLACSVTALAGLVWYINWWPGLLQHLAAWSVRGPRLRSFWCFYSAASSSPATRLCLNIRIKLLPLLFHHKRGAGIRPLQ